MATQHIHDHPDDDTEILQFNLTNPEKLTEQLKNADLNDEETDVLLSEALRVNAQLKEALRMQQLEEGQHKPRSGKGKMKVPHPPPEPLAPRNPRPSTLPPIVTKKDKGYGGDSGKQATNKNAKSKSGQDGQKGLSSPKRKGSGSKSRPAWDDRFSYT